MTSVSQNPPTITRTERGLSIAGTRITLYDVMDYVTAKYPPQFVRSLFNLTEEQMNSALSYIENHRSEVESEYQLILAQAEENRRYWEQRCQEHLVRSDKATPSPNQDALWAKLQAQKARHELEA